MTEITEQHREWATVDRMRDMLGSVRRDYEITQTYTLFAGILCWTLQRIRSEEDGTPLTQRFRDLRKELEKEPVDQFSKRLRAAPRPINPRSEVAFNDLSLFKQMDPNPKSLGVLVALRNAVAHGDARRVLPLNRSGRLVGYQFICRPKEDAKHQWKVEFALNRLGMAQIAGELAGRFCDAAIDPSDDANILEAQKLREAS